MEEINVEEINAEEINAKEINAEGTNAKDTNAGGATVPLAKREDRASNPLAFTDSGM